MDANGLHEKGILDQRFPFRLLMNLDKKFNWPMHWHNAAELLYVVENNFEITVNSKEIALDETDIVFIPGGRPHGFNSASTTGSRIIINFDFSALRHYFDIDWMHIALEDAVIIKRRENAQLHNMLERIIMKIKDEYENKNSAYQLSIMACILDILVILCRNVTDRVSFEMEEEKDKKVTGFKKINSAFKYIEENYSEEISLQNVADAAGFSEFHFSRIFKQITNQNFRQYLVEFRLKKAENLLMDANNTVSMVAYSAGFNSIATFERLFKKVVGCTPLEYRKIGI